MTSILVAEDESRISSFIKKGLQKNGFQTEIAKDGVEALQMMQSNNFDLLLLDLGLPIIDGWTVLQELRNQGNQTPIIVVSAYDKPDTKDEIIEYIAKPFRFQDLLARIQSNL